MQSSTKLFRLAGVTAVIAAGVSLFSSCGGSGESGNAATSVHAEHLATRPLAEFQLDSTAVASGTTIKIVGFSGGNGNQKDTIYYCQFIGINEATEDTVRVLAAFIAVDDAGDEATNRPVLTAAAIYDGHKGVREATFKVPDENDKMIMKMAPELAGGDPDVQKMKGAVEDTTPQKECVIMPEGIRLFAAPRKTVAGILVFKQRPW